MLVSVNPKFECEMICEKADESESHVWDEIEYYETLVEVLGKLQDTGECKSQVQAME